MELGLKAFIFYLEEGLLPELEATTDRLLAVSDMPLTKVAKRKGFQKQLPQIKKRIVDPARELAVFAATAPFDMAALRPPAHVLACTFATLASLL